MRRAGHRSGRRSNHGSLHGMERRTDAFISPAIFESLGILATRCGVGAKVALPCFSPPIDPDSLKWPIISTTSGGRCMVMRLVRDDEMAEKMHSQVDGDDPPTEEEDGPVQELA